MMSCIVDVAASCNGKVRCISEHIYALHVPLIAPSRRTLSSVASPDHHNSIHGLAKTSSCPFTQSCKRGKMRWSKLPPRFVSGPAHMPFTGLVLSMLRRLFGSATGLFDHYATHKPLNKEVRRLRTPKVKQTGIRWRSNRQIRVPVRIVQDFSITLGIE